jgi:curved DNA-binding protein CbpA
VRIPIDYYRILGVPCQAPDEQIQQARDDRGKQLPRREYSERAIEARLHLLEEAYRILSDPDSRREYDARILEGDPRVPSLETPTIGESSPNLGNPTIEVERPYLIGALLFLQELGEYELVARLGEEGLTDPALGPTRDDIVLTIALAYQELSRERWQEKEYETASEIAEKAIGLLEKENSYPSVIDDIRDDFYRLRPYRILELLSRDLGDIRARSRGLALLAETLDDRHGIDGTRNDRSGLKIDDFLRFIQQLRIHLTLEEQQHIFDREARRPSAVGDYLRVYVYLARGFAKRQPEAIVKANERLEKLQKHQDVSLERAICALLLGQVETATAILEKSQDKKILHYIQERSPDPADLLPGLCSYGERWLQSEVLSRFRDLDDRTLSLKEYFADETVQNYLETLSEFPNKKNETDRGELSPDPLESEVTIIPTLPEPIHATVRGESTMSESAYSYPQPRKPSRSYRGTRERSASSPSGDRGGLVVTAAYRKPAAVNPPRRRYRPEGPARPDATVPVAPSRRTRKARRGKLRLDRVAILAAGVFGTIAAFGFGVKAFVDSRSPLAALQGDQLAIELTTPVIEIPSLEARASEPAELTKETAAEVVRSWLAAKGEAMGQGHQSAKLSEILTGPALEIWQKRASALKGNNYWRYDHQIDVRSLTIDPNDKNRATVEARVREKATYFANGKGSAARSYDDTLDIRYDLVRSGDKWLIQNTKVMN